MARTVSIEKYNSRPTLTYDETPDRQQNSFRHEKHEKLTTTTGLSKYPSFCFSFLTSKIGVTVLIVYLLRVIYKHLFGQVEWNVVDDPTLAYEQNETSADSIYWGVHILNAGFASFCGFAVGLFTWMITYMDSVQPGINPPTPVSPRRLRDRSGHTFHMGYVMAIVNGFATFVLTLWYSA